MNALSDSQLSEFRQQLQGDVLVPGESGYETARQIWNAMIERKPALIARCLSVEDVVSAVRFARTNDLMVAIRGGGHNIAGLALCNDGLVIDLTRMKRVTVDINKRRATVESGCTLFDFDAAVQPYGLATPLGINSTTGVAGLTLGGGFGWLSRKYGMTVDNLISAEVVLADGKQMRAAEDENPDLFWGIRGGGGNFGVVTSFEFQLYPVGPEVLTGLIVFPLTEGKSVIQQFGHFTETMPDELNVWMIARQAPPLPFLPEAVHGKEVVVLALCYTGDPEEGRKLIEPLRKFGNAYGEFIGTQPYTAWQQAFDPLLGPGFRNYWKSHNFSRITDGVIDCIVEYAGKLPSPLSDIFIGTIGGQTRRVPPDAMAYSSRDAIYVMNVHGRWETAEEDERGIAWAREFFEKSTPFASSGAYINFLTEEESDRIPAAYGLSYNRLRQVKKTYDPGNFFRVNQNIKPAS